MSKKKIKNDEPEVQNEESQEPRVESQESRAESQESRAESQESPESEIEALKARIEELEDKNLRMMAEFDNYRRRTNKEKLDLMATAGERIFTEMLPLVDDFERAIKSQESRAESQESRAESQESMDEAFKEGVRLIYQKFIAFLDKNDVHAIETEGVDFNTDEHEAVTTFAAGEDKKGKVIDCTQKGYKLGDKVIRFAKVVVGE